MSNTSPLISLASVGLLHLLQEIYGSVLVPAIVRDEYEAGRQPGEPVLDDQAWITTVSVTPALSFVEGLDPGESAVIALAKSLGARAVLLDERRGRRVAAQRGLPVVGTLGVLLRAKQMGHLPAVKPVVDDMTAHGIRISPRLRSLILIEAGEGR